MTIRNGFVRNIDGEWFNLSRVAFFSLRAEFPHGEAMTHRVVAHFDNGCDDYEEEAISYEYYDRDEAQCYLDDIMGFTG